jgi:hypothetical protein
MIGALLVIGVLSAGVFVAVRLLTGQSDDNPIVYIGKDGKEIRFTMTSAPELPEGSSGERCLFLRYEEDNLVVGTGEIGVFVDPEELQKGNLSVDAHYTGPEVEVVVTAKTTIYEDVTDLGFLEDSPGGDYTVQQVLEEHNTLDELEQYAFMNIWGERKGDRLVADMLVYSNVDFSFP